MNSLNVPMNLLTLNSVLNVLTTMGSKQEIQKYALKTIAEAKQFNIEPCLASYYYLLQIFCSDSTLKTFKLTKYNIFFLFIANNFFF